MLLLFPISSKLTVLQKIQELLGESSDDIKVLVTKLNELDDSNDIHQQVIQILSELQLDDLLDVLEEVLPICSNKMQEQIFKLLIVNQKKAQEQYDELLHKDIADTIQESKINEPAADTNQNNVQQRDKNSTLLSCADYTSIDTATIANFMAEAVLSVKLSDSSGILIVEYCKSAFDHPENVSSAALPFFYGLLTNLILRNVQPQLITEMIHKALSNVDQSQHISSHVIMFLWAVLSCKIQESEGDDIVMLLIKISQRSRDYLLACLAGYCHLVIDYHISVPPKRAHQFLGQNQRISYGVTSFVDQLNCENEFNDNSPGILIQFLILQAKSDSVVADLIAKQEPVQEFIQTIITRGDQRYEQIAKDFGNILIRVGQKNGPKDWAPTIMKIIAGKEAKKAPQVADMVM